MSYMDRALKARDPRFRRVLEKLGYQRSDMAPESVEPEPDEMSVLRAEYEAVVGRRPFMGWDAETLTARIAAAKEQD